MPASICAGAWRFDILMAPTTCKKCGSIDIRATTTGRIINSYICNKCGEPFTLVGTASILGPAITIPTAAVDLFSEIKGLFSGQREGSHPATPQSQHPAHPPRHHPRGHHPTRHPGERPDHHTPRNEIKMTNGKYVAIWRGQTVAKRAFDTRDEAAKHLARCDAAGRLID